jgi:hypothetical protein
MQIRGTKYGKKDLNTSIEKIKELATRAWQENVASDPVERRKSDCETDCKRVRVEGLMDHFEAGYP